MTEDLTQSLARIENYSAGLKRLIDIARASAPTRGRGTDRTGVVSAIIGPDGLPRSFRVHRVGQADCPRKPWQGGGRGMASRHARSAGDLVDNTRKQGWQEEADDLRAHPPSHPVEDPQPAPNPRSVDAIAEDMIRALDQRLRPRSARSPAPSPARSTNVLPSD